MKMNKNVIIGCFIVLIVYTLWVFSADDKERIAAVIQQNGNATNIHKIEILNEHKAVAFYQTSDGTEWEMYLEKPFLSWKNRQQFTFSQEGINTPIHLSFFASPYSDEELQSAVLLRVYNPLIERVQIVKDTNILHDFQLFPMGDIERFGLFTTENDSIYDAHFVAYNREGEEVFRSEH